MRKAVFLDRDGTLIRNQHYGCDPEAIELLEGVVEGLRLLKSADYLLIVATNQSGIARAYFTEDRLRQMHRRLGELLEKQGAGIDAFYYCPHHPEGTVPRYSLVCDCRKPQPGMVVKACSDLGVYPSASWFIGDILDDVEAGNRAGCRSILLDVGTEGSPDRPERVPECVVNDFLEAARHVLRGGTRVGKTVNVGISNVGRGPVPRRHAGLEDRAAGQSALPYGVRALKERLHG